MAAPAAPEPAYQAPVSQGNLYYYYYPVQVIIAITITKFERCFVNQWTNAMVGYHLKPLPPQSPSIAQAEPIVEKSDDELDPLVLVLLPITILVGILALISVISKFVGRATTLLLTVFFSFSICIINRLPCAHPSRCVGHGASTIWIR